MANSSLREQLLTLEMAGPRSEPKPHKPLLVAILLRRFIEDGSTSVAFGDIEKEANALIGRFASSSSPPRSQYPFWRLRRDGFWEIDNAARLELNSSGDPKILISEVRTIKGAGPRPPRRSCAPAAARCFSSWFSIGISRKISRPSETHSDFRPTIPIEAHTYQPR